jgi:hypothetical protein
MIYNDDSQGVSETRPGFARADLEAWVDRPLTGLNIDTYAWCIAFPDICQHHTKVGEVYGARFDEPPNDAVRAIAELHAEGTDVLHVVAERARHHGVEFVASVRMNDTHGLYPDSNEPGISQLLIDHPEWVIRRDDGVPERALDYSVPEVRAHRLAILRELAEGYDIDGIELDFTRWAKFFPRDEAVFKAPMMTQFILDVRQMLDEVAEARARDRFILGVQVLESVHLSLLAGLEVSRWVERQSIDYLIQCDFNSTNPQLPVAEFADMCEGSPCTHHVRMGNMNGGSWGGKPHLTGRSTAAYKGNPSYGGMVLTPEEARGAAANIYGFGARGIGLWNICCNLGDRHKAGSTGPDRAKFQQDMFDWITAVDAPEKVWSAERVYHFVPLYKRAELPVRNYPVNALLMGPTGWLTQIVTFSARSQGYRQPYRFLCADGDRVTGDRVESDTADGDRSELSLRGEMRWRILDAVPGDVFRFDLNGCPLDVSCEIEEDEELPALWFTATLSANSGLAGANELGMTLVEREGDATSSPYMEELLVIVEGPDEG